MKNSIKPTGLILLLLSILSITVPLLKPSKQVSASDSDLPDLAIINLYWQPESPIGNANIQFFVIVGNIGNANVTMPFAVDLTVRSIEARWWFGRNVLPVKPGDIWSCPTKEISFAPGTYEVIAEVDRDKRVTDANRENNKMKKTLVVAETAITITKTTATFSLSTITKTATTSSITINKIEYPKEVKPGETFKVVVIVNYEFPDPARIRVGIQERYTNREITFVDTENTRYTGVGTFELWLTSPKENIIWDLLVTVSLWNKPGGGFYYVTHKDLSIVVGQPLQATTTTTTSFIQTTKVETTITPIEEGMEPWAIVSIVGGLLVVVIIIAFSLMRKKTLPTKPPATIICKYCGKELPPDAEFCSECGRKV